MPRLPAVTACFGLLSLLVRHSWAAVSTASCDGLTSCSPAECVRTTEGECTLTAPNVDWPGAVSGLPCKTCTQATSNICDDPASVFLTGGNHIKAVWCNADFLVVAADGLPQYSASDALAGIPLPPGGGTNCRVRNAEAQLNVYKVPLTTQKLANGGSNTLPASIPNVPGMPAGASAFGLDGVPIFPNYNNRGMPTWVSCEVDYCNAHAGRGQDYHYHGDPFGSRCLYSEANYTSSTAHPPLIGFSFDGYKINGRYTATTQQGQGVALDSCGGHEHDSLGYHYHPEVSQGTTTELDGVQNPGTVTYNKFDGSPTTCYAGDVTQISNFFESGTRGQVNYDSTKSTLCDRNDVEDIKPCCGMTNFYAAAGISPNTVAGSGTCTSTGGGGGGGGDDSSGSCSGSTGETGTCSGDTDNTGKNCPPTFGPLPDRPCPPGCTAVCASADTTTPAMQGTTTEAPAMTSTAAASTTEESTTVAGTTTTMTMATAAATTTMAATATTETETVTVTVAVAAATTTEVAAMIDTTDTTDSTTPVAGTTMKPQTFPTVDPTAASAAAAAMPVVWVWGMAAAVAALS